MNTIIKTACKPTLLALREGLHKTLVVERHDGGDAMVINQLEEWITAITRELWEIEKAE